MKRGDWGSRYSRGFGDAPSFQAPDGLTLSEGDGLYWDGDGNLYTIDPATGIESPTGYTLTSDEIDSLNSTGMLPEGDDSVAAGQSQVGSDVQTNYGATSTSSGGGAMSSIESAFSNLVKAFSGGTSTTVARPATAASALSNPIVIVAVVGIAALVLSSRKRSSR